MDHRNGASNAYYARPEHEQCRVNGPGCLDIPSLRIYCQVENQGLSICSSCYDAWRERVRSDPALLARCPVCAAIPRAAKLATLVTPASTGPLTGVAAQAIEKAMHAEGITVDIRTAVLLRLQVQASWLTYAAPALDPEWVDS